MSLFPIENMAMTRYLMYKNNLNNMEDKMLPKRLKGGWHKDSGSWLNYWGIMEDTILKNKDTIKKMSYQNLRIKCGVIKS